MKLAIVLDFETRSRCDLKASGSYRYAQDPTTEILCLCFEGRDGLVHEWGPGGDSAPLMVLALDPEIIFVAHNAGFEKDIWREIMVKRHGFPEIPAERWHCTMSVCAMKQIPLDLDDATKMLGVEGSKDMEGSKLVRSLSKPNKKTGLLPELTPEIMTRVFSYCATDVKIERKLHERIGWLQKGERPVWLLDQTINERGIRLDLPYVHACQKIVDDATTPMAEEFKQLTGGLKFTQVEKIGDWLRSQDVHLPNLQKETLKIALGGDIDDGEDDEPTTLEDDEERTPLPRDVHRALSIRQLVGSASIKKLGRMLACVCDDGRAHRLLQYHGAGPGRWSGRIFQPQNFPRPTLKVHDGKVDQMIGVDAMVDALSTGDYQWVQMMIGAPVHAVVQGLRHAMIAGEGRRFISGDYSQIEARIVLALAGQHDKVDLFRKIGSKIYADMAALIFGYPVDKHNNLFEYTIGKCVILGCGFQMGWKKFKARYCPDQSDAFAQKVIKAYRETWAPEVPRLWRALEEAALMTVYEGTPHEAYGVEYRIDGDWLTARLPSGRKLYYFKPTRCMKTMPWSTPEKKDIRAAWFYLAQKQGHFKRVDAFGGLLTENVVQALARDVLVHATFLLEENAFPIVLTVHDEDLGEPLAADADELAFKQIMEDTQDWVRSLRIPIEVETWAGDRYRK